MIFQRFIAFAMFFVLLYLDVTLVGFQSYFVIFLAAVVPVPIPCAPAELVCKFRVLECWASTPPPCRVRTLIPRILLLLDILNCSSFSAL